jgi:hypothetical protein
MFNSSQITNSRRIFPSHTYLVFFLLLAFLNSSLLYAAGSAGDHIKNWSGDKAPKGWNNDAYSPNSASPEYGDEFNPDGSKKTDDGGTTPTYDPFADEHHPLKNPDGPPPREWLYEQEPVDADYDGKPDVDADGKPVTQDREVTVDKDGDGKPDLDKDGNEIKQKVPVTPADGSQVQRGTADIDWGERYFDQTMIQPVVITNNCRTPQPVYLTVIDLPFLTLPEMVTVPPKVSNIKGKIKLPPEPPPPLRLGLPGEPGWGHVAFGDFFVPAGQPPPKIHQPNFAQVSGSIEAWHPWAPAGDSKCYAKLTTYTVTGHIHFRPPAPPKGPEKLATPDVCEVYWKTGEPPAQLGDKDCTEKFRELATQFITAFLDPYIQNAPEEWSWLPSTADIQQMSMDQLLAMKKHAEAIMGSGDWDSGYGVGGSASSQKTTNSNSQFIQKSGGASKSIAPSDDASGTSGKSLKSAPASSGQIIKRTTK